ncbi:MAG: hypothetical protein AB2L14_29125 [Candidatus Xenobiia bacterium LiM19]
MITQITGTNQVSAGHPGIFKRIAELPVKTFHAIDEYTKPRKETTGDLDKHSYVLSTSVADGIAVMGIDGLPGSLVASKVGVFVANMTGNTSLGVVAGGAAGAALGVGLSMVAGVPMLPAAVFSGLLGAYETFRGNPKSHTRDAASGANIISAPFLPGPLKIAGAIGAAAGTEVKSPLGKALVGGAASALIAGAVAVLGLSPVGIPIAIGASFLAGATGPFFGPRFSQLFRNLASDIGSGIAGLARKVGIKKEFNPTIKNLIGVFPSSIVKESIRTFALSDGDPFKTILACSGEALKQGYIFYKQVKPEKTTPVTSSISCDQKVGQ